MLDVYYILVPITAAMPSRPASLQGFESICFSAFIYHFDCFITCGLLWYFSAKPVWFFQAFFFRDSYQCNCAKSLQLCLTLCDPMDCRPQSPLSMEFFRQEYWSGLPFSSPRDPPDPEIEPGSPALQALPSELLGKPQV